ncbi:hypothetical protein F2P81_023818 [Scophthalmus maximus]|uniref:Uncharacterized protein n=1 Tax=Scophthalmus maximus TaxID=52904 RepID=A0A6A4RT16_SCOMX|nr:hypothetical protein F2P81_023818 [Scophthalmus maximus]
MHGMYENVHLMRRGSRGSRNEVVSDGGRDKTMFTIAEIIQSYAVRRLALLRRVFPSTEPRVNAVNKRHREKHTRPRTHCADDVNSLMSNGARLDVVLDPNNP